MANEKTMKPKADKAVKDLRAAEIVYYSIGGIVLLTGLVFSIFGVILLNPITPNFEGSLLLEAQTAFFQW